ncbi:MAG: glycosyltransferase family 2 protein [Verrucomicrobiae bacterium]|nr:glycosyltransferase family 2 protein [Verrucomicrobiae bacterium]
MSPISVIIVSWNAQHHLRNCLISLRENGGGLVQEIIVVDNASADGSPDMVQECFPEVTLIRAGQNLGFARANNLGIKHATGSYLALVNSDVVVHPGCFEELTNYLESHSSAGLVGPRITGGDGLLQRSCRRLPSVWNLTCSVLALDRVFPRHPLFSGFELRHWNYDHLGEVEVLSGCFWLVRRSAVEKVGGLDERFFFYAEDLDWCKSFRDAGWKNVYVPQATATHFGGGSSANAPLRYSIEMLRANLKYWKKHYGGLGQCTYYVLALLYHGIRLVARFALSLGLSDRNGNHKLREHFVCLRWLLTGKGA